MKAIQRRRSLQGGDSSSLEWVQIKNRDHDNHTQNDNRRHNMNIPNPRYKTHIELLLSFISFNFKEDERGFYPVIMPSQAFESRVAEPLSGEDYHQTEHLLAKALKALVEEENTTRAYSLKHVTSDVLADPDRHERLVWNFGEHLSGELVRRGTFGVAKLAAAA